MKENLNRYNSYSASISTGLLQHSFGMLMQERSYSSSAYKFGFNGQEKDEEVDGSGNTNTAEYWEYDTRLGRRWNLDPIPQICISDYVCFANAPVLNRDIKGDKWDPENGSEKSAEDFKVNAKERMGKIQKSISEISDKISKLDVNSKSYEADRKKYEGQITNATDKLNELKDAIDELEVLKNSAQIYSLRPQVLDPNNPTEGGSTTYEMRGDVGIVVLNYLVGDNISKAHELKHGYQYEKGLTSIAKIGGGKVAGLLHDLTDERAAYRRGSAFNDNTPKLSNLTDQDIIRRSPESYGGLPSVALDKTMVINDILEAHSPDGPTSIPYKYELKTFDSYEEDYFIK